jgi:deoxycytidylate deaminase
MNRIYKIVNDMCQFPYNGNMNSRHLAVAVKNGKKISDYKYNYIQILNKNSIHAEAHLINSLFKNKKLSNITLVVIRISKNNKLMNSKPCCDCIKIIKNSGFKKVCYSTGKLSTPLIIERVNTLNNDHKSQLARHKKY